MISLDLKQKDFKGNEKWPLLYVICDIYFNYSSIDNPLLDGVLVKIAKNNYNLSIERHLIKKYRTFLSHYFGIEFSQIKKGYYIANDIKLINDGIKKNNYPKFVKNFNEFKMDDEVRNKVSIISAAINRKRKIRLKIENYLYFASYYLIKNKHKDPIFIKPKTMVVNPLRLFIFSDKTYLLSFNDNDNHFYFHLLETTKITKESITRIKSTENISFDLEKYIEKQDFIVTGPIDENYSFKKDRNYEPYGAVGIKITKKEDLTEPDMPSLYQSLIDLYGEDEVSFETVFEHPTRRLLSDKKTIELVFDGDDRIDSFYDRFKGCREITGFDY